MKSATVKKLKTPAKRTIKKKDDSLNLSVRIKCATEHSGMAATTLNTISKALADGEFAKEKVTQQPGKKAPPIKKAVGITELAQKEDHIETVEVEPNVEVMDIDSSGGEFDIESSGDESDGRFEAKQKSPAKEPAKSLTRKGGVDNLTNKSSDKEGSVKTPSAEDISISTAVTEAETEDSSD